MEKNCSDFELKLMLISMVKLLGKNTLKMMWRTRALGLGMLGAQIRRKRTLKKGGLQVPKGIGLSPTMRCNLSCRGCYARLYPDVDKPHSRLQRFSCLLGKKISIKVLKMKKCLLK